MPDILNLTVRDFLAATAARQPTPGGGSVAALCGVLAASLATMAMNYTVGKKAYAVHDAELKAAIAQFQTASQLFQELVAEDIAAYEALSVMLKLPAEKRQSDLNYAAAVVAAIRAPQTAAALAAAILERCHALLDKTNKFLLGDLAVAAVYAHATVHASEFLVLINLPMLPNQSEAAALKQNLTDLAQKADKTYQTIRAHMLKPL